MSKSFHVLCVCYGGGHVAMVIPVIRALSRRYPDARLTVLGLTTARAVLEKEGIPCLGFKDLLRPQDGEAVRQGGRLAAEQPPHPQIHPEETVAYLGLSYRDLVMQLGISGAEQAYSSRGRAAFKPLPTLIRYLSEIRPNVVVATNSPRAEQAAIDAARVLGVPSLCIVDLFVGLDAEWVARPGYADRICVLADAARERLLALGRYPEEVVVTGNPAFDVLAHRPGTQTLLEFRARHGVAPGGRVIFWASQEEPSVYVFTGEQGNPDLPREVDRQLMALVACHPDWHLVIRPHPSEQVVYPDPLPDRVSISRSPGELLEVLEAADVVITFSSTVGLEGAIIGKPLISLQQSVHSKYAPFLNLGIARLVHHWSELETAIESALNGGPAHVPGLPPPGQSAERIAELIHDLAQSPLHYDETRAC